MSIDQDKIRQIVHAGEQRAMDAEAKRRADEAERSIRNQQIVRESANQVVRHLPELIEKWAKDGTIGGTIMTIDGSEFVKKVRFGVFHSKKTGNFGYSHLPDYARRVYDYCAQNGLSPELSYVGPVLGGGSNGRAFITVCVPGRHWTR